MQTLFERMIDENQPLINAYCDHPFNQELYKGTLPQNKFLWFLQQDAKYLKIYAIVMLKISEHLKDSNEKDSNEEDAKLFERFRKETISAEQFINESYLKKCPHESFFSHSTETCVSVKKYTSHLLEAADKKSLVEAIVSCYPCFLLYAELGKRYKDNPKNDYSEWTTMYSDPLFIDSVNAINTVLKKMTDSISDPVLEEKVIECFKTSAEFEIAFCEETMEQFKSAALCQPTLA